ncbi:c-type cytochrome [Salinicola sp. LHM]|uniref:c-type cytochrome n=1 Tax=Salinicola TaxID=404432 RepID=UPI001481C35B|nr:MULTISPECIES: c-type cytochrome [Salinicola]MDF3920188.1 c-type cytochrome [Salinicola salarius]MEC8918971.1 c-type cytochrome [Pseudomonadota bacterium]MED5501041.1 c-type cytochrome [Pseudomonadota bacterium]WQH33184.1 c-type cytochrome [Salinicola sp. LHM]
MRLRFSLPLTAILLASSLTAPAQAADGEAIFEDNCAGCHDGGGAPQIGDNDAWQSRIDEGMDELYANAINGVGGMPAKGGNADLTNGEVKAAVDYIVDESE